MPAQDPAEVVRRFSEGWATGDLGVVLDCVHPEMEFDWSESIGPFKGVYRGRDGLQAYWRDVREVWNSFNPVIEEVLDFGGGCLVTPTTVHGRASGTGIELEARAAMLWVVRDGRIAHGKIFQTTDEAVLAARAL